MSRIKVSVLLLFLLAGCQQYESEETDDSAGNGFRKSFPDAYLFSDADFGRGNHRPSLFQGPPRETQGMGRPGGQGCRPGSAGCDYDQFIYFSNLLRSYNPEYTAFVWLRAFVNPGSPSASPSPVPVPLSASPTPLVFPAPDQSFAAAVLEIELKHPKKLVPVRGFAGDGGVRFYNLPVASGVSPGILMRVDSSGGSAALIAVKTMESSESCSFQPPSDWWSSWWWQPPSCPESPPAPPVDMTVRLPRSGAGTMTLQAPFETGVLKHFESFNEQFDGQVRVFGKTLQYRGEGLYRPFR